MKKLLIIFGFTFLVALTVDAQKVNDKVQIEHNGSWYDGTILKVNAENGQYFVTYEGWSESWDEWVGLDRLKGYAAEQKASPLTKFRLGDRVEVDYGMVPEPARIITVGENKYEIEFDNKSFGKKWVTEKLIKKL